MDYKSSDYPRYFYSTYMCNPDLEIQINLKDKNYKNYEKKVVIRYGWCCFLNTFPEQQLTLYCLFIYYSLIEILEKL